ncbi:unnamed protein product [Euphydryas editha]|uniref:Uncharacterized protein n=1 Tax=Euphydryas editha TaxID=104508 RepID=A0AAU9TJ68_EUPED|nr:unnamed protein product [Euphydryas editha]
MPARLSEAEEVVRPYLIANTSRINGGASCRLNEERMALINQKSPSVDFHGDFPSSFTTSRGVLELMASFVAQQLMPD